MSDSEPPFLHHQINPDMIPLPQHGVPTRVTSANVANAFESPASSGDVPTAQVVAVKAAELSPRWSGVNKVVVAICWLLVSGFIVFSLLTPYVAQPTQGEVQDQPLGMTDQVEAMYFLGWREMTGGQDDEQIASLFEQADSDVGGTYNQRLGKAALVGELMGYEQGESRLAELADQAAQAGYEPTEQERTTHDALQRAFSDYQQEEWEAPSVPEAEREAVIESLGWIGALALEPAGTDSPRRLRMVRRSTNFVMFLVVALVVGGLVLLLGCFFAFLAFVLMLTGNVRSSLKPQTTHGHVYMETFVVWMLGFIGISLLISLLVPAEGQLTANLIGFPASLLALAWPVLRGVSLADLFSDLGITLRTFWLEPVAGFVGYVAGLPLLLMSGIFMGILMAVFGEKPSVDNFEPIYEPSHPINETMEAGGIWTILVVAITACVLAPLVEETVFRGVLYRHLRDMTAPLRVVLSTLVSAAVSGFVFAAIHPQGIFVVPVLGTLGFIFALVREWRGSLVAPMVMHAIHNGLVTTMLIVLMSVSAY